MGFISVMFSCSSLGGKKHKCTVWRPPLGFGAGFGFDSRSRTCHRYISNDFAAIAAEARLARPNASTPPLPSRGDGLGLVVHSPAGKWKWRGESGWGGFARLIIMEGTDSYVLYAP